MTEHRTVRAKISGRVQHVAFRNWTRVEAQTRGLTGWIRNEADGSVTALLSGPPDAVQEMVKALHRGPPAARVTGVALEQLDEPVRDGFEIRR